ncbi:MAG: GNAT family protein [Dehalococcoidales bacterium]|jgi:ribosomal-protein-alanine N-acetyltransferase
MDRGIFKDLETGRLLLRNLAQDDAAFFYREFSDPAVSEYLFDADPPESVNEVLKWIAWYNDNNPDHNRWVIVNKETGLRMGTCGFHIWDARNNRVEIGYDLLPEFWGKGYMREALQAAIDFAFTIMNIHRIYAVTYTGNHRSIKVLEKLGFHKEGLLRDQFLFRGKYYDHFQYSLLKEESGI